MMTSLMNKRHEGFLLFSWQDLCVIDSWVGNEFFVLLLYSWDGDYIFSLETEQILTVQEEK